MPSINLCSIPLIIPEQIEIESSTDFTSGHLKNSVLDTSSMATVREGKLKKRNKWYSKQQRYFILQRDGQILYYKDQVKLKGTI